MSYKSDMEFFRNQVQKRKNRIAMLLKMTVVTLAASIVLGSVALVLSLSDGESSMGNGGSSDHGGTDRSAPVFQGPERNTAVHYIGDTISYRGLVKVTDNAKVTLDIDNSAVDTNTPGTYSVKYTATDAAGNRSEYTLTLIVKSGEYSKTKLMELIAAKASQLGMSKEMSKETLVRKIYEYVKDPSKGGSVANIRFNDVSNTPSQASQAGQKERTGWEVDWVEEAYRTLTMSRMGGDCYTYYSVSKAFFEYFEIENIGIQRSPTSVQSGTHYWHIVNVGTAQKPQWYFYDSTRLAGKFEGYSSNSSCLINEAKLNAYVGSKGEKEFYKFEKWDGFPTIAAESLT